jgi:hypothetical protein
MFYDSWWNYLCLKILKEVEINSSWYITRRNFIFFINLSIALHPTLSRSPFYVMCGQPTCHFIIHIEQSMMISFLGHHPTCTIKLTYVIKLKKNKTFFNSISSKMPVLSAFKLIELSLLNRFS